MQADSPFSARACSSRKSEHWTRCHLQDNEDKRKQSRITAVELYETAGTLLLAEPHSGRANWKITKIRRLIG